MAKRFTSTPDVPRIDGGVTIFRSCLVSRRVPGRRVVHQVALRALRHRVHRQPRADLLHRPRLLLRPHADPDHGRHRRPQRLRRRRRRASGHELPLLHLLRDQQEGAQHPRRARATAPRPTRSSARSAASTTTASPPRCSTSTSSRSCGARTTASPSSSAAASTASRSRPTPPATTARSSRTRPWATTRTSWCRRRCSSPPASTAPAPTTRSRRTAGPASASRFVNPSISVGVTQKKLHRLAEEKVDVLVHMCPNCHVQFDRYTTSSPTSTGEEFPFIHLHVQQLLALALGADPEKVVGIQSHSQDVEPFLERIGARQPPRRPEARDEGRGLSLRVRRQHQRRRGPRAAGRARALPRRRRRGRRQPVHVRHRRPRDDREGRGRARPRPLRHRLVLAALPGPDLRAHRP